jgi:hypothetical protein
MKKRESDKSKAGSRSRPVSKQEREEWLNRKAKQLELEEANRKKRNCTVKEFDRLMKGVL